jgi:hypothetical protein
LINQRVLAACNQYQIFDAIAVQVSGQGHELWIESARGPELFVHEIVVHVGDGFLCLLREGA